MDKLAKYILAALLLITGAVLALVSKDKIVVTAGIGTVASGSTLIIGMLRTVPRSEHEDKVRRVASGEVNVVKRVGLK